MHVPVGSITRREVRDWVYTAISEFIQVRIPNS